MKRDVVLWKDEFGQVFVKLTDDYMLHVADENTIERLPASQIILLVDATIEEHTRQTVQ